MLNTVYWFLLISHRAEKHSPLWPVLQWAVGREGFVQVLYFIISTSVNKNSQHFLQVIYLILVVNSLEIGKRCIVEPGSAMCPGYCDNAKLFLSSWKIQPNIRAREPVVPWSWSVSRWCCNRWASPWHLYWDKSLLLANTISCWP